MKGNKLHVYFGIGLLEVLENNKSNPELKLLLARLYNSGVKVKTLIEHFGFSYPTYKHWGDALKSGDEEWIYRALSGHGGGGKKLKPDIVAFIIHDFGHVFPRNKYSYSKEIRQDVKDVYNTSFNSNEQGSFCFHLGALIFAPFLNKLEKKGQWDEGGPYGKGAIEKKRNNKNDVKLVHYRYQEKQWGKHPSMRQIIVRIYDKN